MALYRLFRSFLLPSIVLTSSLSAMAHSPTLATDVTVDDTNLQTAQGTNAQDVLQSIDDHLTAPTPGTHVSVDDTAMDTVQGTNA